MELVFGGGGGLGAIKFQLGQRPSQRLQKQKIGIFRGALKYLIRTPSNGS